MGRPPTAPGTHGHIRKYRDKRGRFIARTLLRLYNGQTVQVEATRNTENEAIAALEERCQKRLQSAKGGTKDITGESKLEELLDRWISQHDVKQRSREIYQAAIDKHIKPGLGQIRLTELTTGTLQYFLEGLTPGTAKTSRAVLSNALGLAVRWDVIARNPMADVKLKRQGKPPVRALTDAEIQEYRDTIEAWIKGAKKGYSRGAGLLEIVDVLIGSGARIGEVLALRWQEVDFEQGTISITGTVAANGERQDTPKTNSSRRTIHITQGAMDAIKRMWEIEKENMEATGATEPLEMVFPSSRDTYRTVTNVSNQLKRARGDSEITAHLFRKTVATRIGDNIGELAASRQLGHSNTTVTEQSYLARPKIQPDYTDTFEAKIHRKPTT